MIKAKKNVADVLMKMGYSRMLFRCLIILVSVIVLFDLSAHAKSFRVMTFNIKYDEPRDGVNSWPNRKQRVVDVLKKYDPDLIGVQEALVHQLKEISVMMPGLKWVGVGRTDGAEEGEFSAILFKASRFEVKRSGTFWLSETPDVVGSKGWDAAFPRIVTWAEFRDKHSKKDLFLFNTHFDHVGQTARLNSAKLLLEKASKLARKGNVIITGDFNANYANDVYKAMVAEGSGVDDAKALTNVPYTGVTSTFSGFKELRADAWIDHIFVGNRIKVKKLLVVEDRPDGLWPSDHLPVQAEVTFGKRKNSK